MNISQIIKYIFQNSTRKKINNSLKKLIYNGEETKINFIDVGAAGEVNERWRYLSKNINYFGFEPDERSRLLLKNDYNFNFYKIFPDGLWNISGEFKINLTNKPEASSLYKPNYKLLNLFPLKERFLIDKTLNINCVSLDSLKLENLDFIKIDIQGGELKVLEGASQSLKKCLGLELEVEFLELYKNQPLFGDVVSFLQEKNIEFIDFTTINRWGRKKYDGMGQLTFGDALFLRTPEYIIENFKNDNVIKLKYLGICLIYNRFDLIDKLIEISENDFKFLTNSFLISLESLKRKNNNLRRMNFLFTKFMALFFPNFKSHPLY